MRDIEGVAMRILVYGAGVQGSLYAARLHERGHDVALLARGQRVVDLRAHGVILEEITSRRHTVTPVSIVERLDPTDVYDLVMVPVRREQIGAILPALAAARRIPTILFMHNHAGGSDELVTAVGRERVLLGFPGASGAREGAVVKYVLIPQQPTTLGELDGTRSPRVREIAAVLRGAGFRVAISRQMDTWLKVHAVFVTAVSGALYLAGGDPHHLARMPDGVPLFARGVREGFGAIDALGLKPPTNLRAIFGWLPNRITVAYWRRLFSSERGEYYFVRHARPAWAEASALAAEVRTLLRQSGRPTPTFDRLCTSIDAYAAAHGEATLPA